MGVKKNIEKLNIKVEEITVNLKKLINEEKHTRDMVLGALQILKHMPGHQKAVEEISKQFKKQNERKGD